MRIKTFLKQIYRDDKVYRAEVVAIIITSILLSCFMMIFLCITLTLTVARPLITVQPVGISMYPTIWSEDDVLIQLVNQTVYRFKPPKRGDIIVTSIRFGSLEYLPDDRFVRIKHPLYWNRTKEEYVHAQSELQFRRNMKRIIGMPGETIEIRAKQVYINGVAFNHGTEHFTNEPPIPPGLRERIGHEYIEEHGLENWVRFSERRDFMEALYIPEGYYFIMGDNRDSSRDSRHYGLVAGSDIMGRVRLVAYSRRDGKPHFFRKVK